ncbi:MAG TPA: hypothetical protein VFJ29_06975, partial [Candidatus Kapabacteria bacterium]|nr:hypothetical protein [Candidatus Kapabacteria bacterium]
KGICMYCLKHEYALRCKKIVLCALSIMTVSVSNAQITDVLGGLFKNISGGTMWSGAYMGNDLVHQHIPFFSTPKFAYSISYGPFRYGKEDTTKIIYRKLIHKDGTFEIIEIDSLSRKNAPGIIDTSGWGDTTRVKYWTRYTQSRSSVDTIYDSLVVQKNKPGYFSINFGYSNTTGINYSGDNGFSANVPLEGVFVSATTGFFLPNIFQSIKARYPKNPGIFEACWGFFASTLPGIMHDNFFQTWGVGGSLYTLNTEVTYHAPNDTTYYMSVGSSSTFAFEPFVNIFTVKFGQSGVALFTDLHYQFASFSNLTYSIVGDNNNSSLKNIYHYLPTTINVGGWYMTLGLHVNLFPDEPSGGSDS